MTHSSATDFIADFRQAAPYIHYLRGKTIVLAISSHVLLADKLDSLAKDIQLLASLGVQLVLVHGTRQYLNNMMRAAGSSLQYHRGWRITDEATLQHVKQACGMVRFDIEAALSTSPEQTPDRGNQRLRVASGNFILAKPLGVLDGIDMGYTGRIRKVDSQSIQQLLNEGALVLVSPLGQSLTGKSFNLGLDDVAQALATTLKAEKLIFLGTEAGVYQQGQLISQLTVAQAEHLLAHGKLSADISRMLKASIHVLEQGVRRAHILSGLTDGSLIAELFTRQGSGTALAQTSFMRIRAADNKDVGDIVRLISPLENAGVLLPRSREYLENHIQEFFVLEHDHHVYGCVALQLFAEASAAELACLVVSPDAQDGGYGELLLEHVIKQAQSKGAATLFALSTNTGDWFDERGFKPADVSELPQKRQALYLQSKRQSKIYRRAL